MRRRGEREGEGEEDRKQRSTKINKDQQRRIVLGKKITRTKTVAFILKNFDRYFSKFKMATILVVDCCMYCK